MYQPLQQQHSFSCQFLKLFILSLLLCNLHFVRLKPLFVFLRSSLGRLPKLVVNQYLCASFAKHCLSILCVLTHKADISIESTVHLIITIIFFYHRSQSFIYRNRILCSNFSDHRITQSNPVSMLIPMIKANLANLQFSSIFLPR